MRFSFANILLLGAVLAAPLQQADRGSKHVQKNDVVARGWAPIDLYPRASPPGKGKAPIRPDVDAPAPPLRPGDKPDAPPPRLGDARPNPAGRLLEGADTELAIDIKYHRMQTKADPLELPMGPFRTEGQETGEWYTTVIGNSPSNKAKFETDVIPKMEQQLKKEGLNEKQIKKILNVELAKFGPNGAASEMSRTHENPKAGEIIIEDAKTKENDIFRDYTRTARVGGKITNVVRPGIDPDQQVKHKRMIADNYRVAAYKEKKPVTDLKAVNRFNIVTESTQQVFKRYIDDPPDEKVERIVRPDETFFDDITKNTVHGYQIDAILKDEPDFKGLQITQYTVYREPSTVGSGGNVWHMRIHTAKQ